MINKNDAMLNEIVEYLKNKHSAHTIILYGSRARNEASDSSDYDLIAIRDQGEFERDCQIFNGFYLDAFIYPEEALKHPDNYVVRAKDGIVLCQKNQQGDDFINNIKKIFNEGPSKIPDWEKREILVWLGKMFDRAKINDIEGNFRLHWLLHDLLECYFKLRDEWYLGPKESFKWLEAYDKPTFNAFAEALRPNTELKNVSDLIDCVIKK